MKTLNIVYVTEQQQMKLESDLIVHGENHFDYDEVESIRESVKSEYTKNTIVLHELSRMDRKYYEKEGIKIEQLEKMPKKKSSMKLKFITRESNMITKIDEALEKYDRVIVVVGDTHLRTIETKELGEPTLYNYLMALQDVNVTIHRSNNPEIK